MKRYFVDEHGWRYGRLTVTAMLLSIVVNIAFSVTGSLGAAGGGGAPLWDAAAIGLWFAWLTLAVTVLVCLVLWIVGIARRRAR